jgi:hypothetical protein
MTAVYTYIDNRTDPPTVVLEVKTDQGILFADGQLLQQKGLDMARDAWLGCNVELDQTRV